MSVVRISAVPLAGNHVPGGSNVITMKDCVNQPDNKADGVHKNFFIFKKGRDFVCAILIPPRSDTDRLTFSDIDSAASFDNGMSFTKKLHQTVVIVGASY